MLSLRVAIALVLRSMNSSASCFSGPALRASMASSFLLFRLLLAHVLIGKPVPTFPGHAHNEKHLGPPRKRGPHSVQSSQARKRSARAAGKLRATDTATDGAPRLGIDRFG